jgi:hypothetical protein
MQSPLVGWKVEQRISTGSLPDLFLPAGAARFTPEQYDQRRVSFTSLRTRGNHMATAVDSRRETVSLIGSEKVEGTAVYGADEKKIGSVQRVMIDKVSGKVAYAVVSLQQAPLVLN